MDLSGFLCLGAIALMILVVVVALFFGSIGEILAEMFDAPGCLGRSC